MSQNHSNFCFALPSCLQPFRLTDWRRLLAAQSIIPIDAHSDAYIHIQFVPNWMCLASSSRFTLFSFFSANVLSYSFFLFTKHAVWYTALKIKRKGLAVVQQWMMFLVACLARLFSACLCVMFIWEAGLAQLFVCYLDFPLLHRPFIENFTIFQ